MHQMRMGYTACHKVGLLALGKQIQEEEGLSLCQAAECLMVSHSLLVRWQKQQATEGDPILAMIMSRRKANCAGPLEQLKPLEGTLLWFIFEQHEQGINMTTLVLVIKASSLSPMFNAKHFIVRTSAAK